MQNTVSLLSPRQILTMQFKKILTCCLLELDQVFQVLISFWLCFKKASQADWGRGGANSGIF